VNPGCLTALPIQIWVLRRGFGGGRWQRGDGRRTQGGSGGHGREGERVRERREREREGEMDRTRNGRSSRQ